MNRDGTPRIFNAHSARRVERRQRFVGWPSRLALIGNRPCELHDDLMRTRSRGDDTELRGISRRERGVEELPLRRGLCRARGSHEQHECRADERCSWHRAPRPRTHSRSQLHPHRRPTCSCSQLRRLARAVVHGSREYFRPSTATLPCRPGARGRSRFPLPRAASVPTPSRAVRRPCQPAPGARQKSPSVFVRCADGISLAR